MSMHAMPRVEVFELPSGIKIDLRGFDPASLLTVADCEEAISLLASKMAELEYQIGLHVNGMHADGEPFSPSRPKILTWEPRARKVLALTTVQRDRTERRALALGGALAVNHDRLDVMTCFIGLAQIVLGESEATRLWLKAQEMHKAQKLNATSVAAE